MRMPDPRVLTKSIDKSGVLWRYRFQPPSPAAYLSRNRAADGALSDFVRTLCPIHPLLDLSWANRYNELRLFVLTG